MRAEALLPFFIGLGAFILQVDNVARVVAAHLAIAVLDHAVLVVTAKQFQASLFYSLHLSIILGLNTVRTPGIESLFSLSVLGICTLYTHR